MKFFKPFEPPTEPSFPDYAVDIRDFGAVSGTDVSSHDAIKKAIEHVSAKGGGRVAFSRGEWLTGPIHLKSNVNLHFEEGCVVHFSTKFEDYLPTVYGILAGNRVYSPSHLLYAYKCENIALTGNGTLNGHGEAWWHMKHHQPGMEDLIKKGKSRRPLSERVYDKPEDGVRPRMLQFVECENVLIENLTFTNSPSWTVHPAWCKNIIVRGLTIKNPTDPHVAPNTDGINFDSCRRGLIEDCDITTGDDMICLKAGRDEDAWEVGIPCEDIEVRNCRSHGSLGGITVGSETSACIRNAWFHDITLGSHYSAVNIKTMKGRGGTVENLDFENITIESATRPSILTTLRYTGEKLDDQSAPKINMPKVRNISVKNFVCRDAKTGIGLYGERGFEIENVHLENLDLTCCQLSEIEDAVGVTMVNVNHRKKEG